MPNVASADSGYIMPVNEICSNYDIATLCEYYATVLNIYHLIGERAHYVMYF